MRNKSPAQLFLKTRGVVLLGRGDIKARKNQKSGQVEDAIFPFYINKKQRTRRAKKHAIIPYKRTYKENMCIKTTFIKCSSGLDMYTITGFGRTSPVCQKKRHITCTFILIQCEMTAPRLTRLDMLFCYPNSKRHRPHWTGCLRHESSD